jgi:hypothetical protein
MTVAWELVRTGYLLRSVRLTPFLPAAVVAVVLMLRGGGPDTVTYARELGLLLALGGGYALDDGAAETLRAGPYGLARRLGLRMGLAVVVVVPLWARRGLGGRGLGPPAGRRPAWPDHQPGPAGAAAGGHEDDRRPGPAVDDDASAVVGGPGRCDDRADRRDAGSGRAPHKPAACLVVRG